MYGLSLLVFKAWVETCQDLLILSHNISDITIIAIKGADYHGSIYDVSKSETTNFLEDSVLNDSEFI